MPRVKLGEILGEHQPEVRAAMKKILREYAPDHEAQVGTISRKSFAP